MITEIPPKNKLKVFTVTREVEYLQNVYVLATDEDQAEEIAREMSESDWIDNDVDGNSQISGADDIEVSPHGRSKKFAKQAINAHWLATK